jgi:hypothetical protein
MARHSAIFASDRCEYIQISQIRALLVADDRNRSVDLMKTLVAKYPDGYEGWAKEHGEVPVERSFAKM